MKNGNSLVLQPRDRNVLQYLGILRILSRDQIACVAGFSSITRVNVRLHKLRDVGLVARYFTAGSTGSMASIYALTREGAEAVQVGFVPLKWKADSVVLGNAFVAHQLATNDIYIAATQEPPAENLQCRRLVGPLPGTKIIPDALIEFSQNEIWRAFFLEVDLGTEALPRWTRKVQQYLSLATSGRYREAVRSDKFSALVVATDRDRMESLRKHIAKQTEKLFWFTTLEIIKQRGFWSPIWLRPAGDQQVPPGA